MMLILKNEWIYQGQPFTEDMIGDWLGFVYQITNLDNGKKYIGRKLFTKSKTVQKNKKKKKTRAPSDWLTYTGSNAELNEAVKDGARLHKEIIHLCASKGWLNYLESKEIFVRDALLDPNYYNQSVRCTVHQVHLGISSSKKKMSKKINVFREELRREKISQSIKKIWSSRTIKERSRIGNLISNTVKGFKHTQEAKNRMTETRRNYKWFNNGTINTRSENSPGPDWKLGRVRAVK